MWDFRFQVGFRIWGLGLGGLGCWFCGFGLEGFGFRESFYQRKVLPEHVPSDRQCGGLKNRGPKIDSDLP